jgi:shikimate kinase
MNVVLIGMKHCGKSTVGRGLARDLGEPFVDTDQRIEALFAADHGSRCTVREIFANHGEACFTGLERRVVRALASDMRDSQDSRIVAMGGHTALQPELRPIIREMGRVVYLCVDPAELLRRVLAGGVPPFLDPADPKGSFHALCRQRAPVYESLADLTVDLDGLTPEQSVHRVLRELSAD